MPIEIRPATNEAERAAVYGFRYAIYVSEMKRKQRYADHNAGTIKDPLDGDDAYVLAAWESAHVVGTIRCNLLRDSDVGEYFDLYGLSAVDRGELAMAAIATRFMVHPRHRATLLCAQLSCHLYGWGLQQGVSTTYMDCNSHLVPFFRSLGFREHRASVTHPEYGQVTIMRLEMLDARHLRLTSSLFSRVLSDWRAGSTLATSE
jgi:hypothetical protein